MRIKRVTNNLGQKIASLAVGMLGVGVVLAIWGGVWLVYLYRNPPESEAMLFVAAGIFLSGLDLGLIGFSAGFIGRAARESSSDEVRPSDRIAVATPNHDNEPVR
ncbi:hypothetical protein [Tautonia rosea]|uniref:hypothetical protein n=1 Tax=Tautonia rosea TaxID=2728037 RepID=UPI001475BF4D|nr:hypothetical protein [Tautonia rosea]